MGFSAWLASLNVNTNNVLICDTEYGSLKFSKQSPENNNSLWQNSLSEKADRKLNVLIIGHEGAHLHLLPFSLLTVSSSL